MATHNPHRGGIHLKDLFLVVKHDALTGAFEERAKFFFGLAKRALRAFAFSVVNDAGTNQILTFRGQTQQPDLGGDKNPIGMPVNPFEHRRASRQSFRHFLSGQFSGVPAVRLEFRTHIRRCQIGQSFHRHSVKNACVLVAEEKSTGVAVKNHDRLRSVLDEGAKLRFARGQRSGAFRDAAFERLVQLQQLVFGFLPFRNVARSNDQQAATPEAERCQQHFHGEGLAVVTLGHPFKALRAVCQRTLNPRLRRFTGRAPVWLLLWREAFD